MIPFPKKRYSIIYADPPWSYHNKPGESGFRFPVQFTYKTQNINWIKQLPVQSIAEKNSVLFLWCVSPQIPEALEVITSWEFKYKTLAFCWSKETTYGKHAFNLGRWTMGNVELCLLGVRGHPHRIVKNIKQLVIAKRTIPGRKPDEVRKRIVELMGNVPRIELFARERHEGWDVWGDEI